MASPHRTPLIAGNWKMHKTADEAIRLVRDLRERLAGRMGQVEVAVAPSFTALHAVGRALEDSGIRLAGQNCHWEAQGAFTGEVSAGMLRDVGCTYVILGHSERRQLFGEKDATVSRRSLAALREGLRPIVCIGETLEQRGAGAAITVVAAQIEASLPPSLNGRPFVIAYEPVWAIGSGLTPRLDEIEEIHGAIRRVLTGLFGREGEAVPILYGGSVKPANAVDILNAHEVGGALVGGASLKAVEFAGIIEAI